MAQSQTASAWAWREYLIEGWALGMFMLSAAWFTTLLESPLSPLHRWLPDPQTRLALIGLAMGLTAIALIYSPWGKRSGAHMNPAVTLAFLHLGRIRARDALGYVVAHFAGGTIGVLVGVALLGAAFTEPPVMYVRTLPGSAGSGVAFLSELLISAGMLALVLALSAHARLAPYTGLAAGALVALYITFEAPLSGMSMNPARSFASAAPAGAFESLWIYLLAPPLGMLAVAQLARRTTRPATLPCAKLSHDLDYPCIHCGHRPSERRR